MLGDDFEDVRNTFSTGSIQDPTEATPILSGSNRDYHIRSIMKTPGSSTKKSVSWSDKREGASLIEIHDVPKAPRSPPNSNVKSQSKLTCITLGLCCLLLVIILGALFYVDSRNSE